MWLPGDLRHFNASWRSRRLIQKQDNLSVTSLETRLAVTKGYARTPVIPRIFASNAFDSKSRQIHCRGRTLLGLLAHHAHSTTCAPWHKFNVPDLTIFDLQSSSQPTLHLFRPMSKAPLCHGPPVPPVPPPPLQAPACRLPPSKAQKPALHTNSLHSTLSAHSMILENADAFS
jgi:hypothetical protein